MSVTSYGEDIDTTAFVPKMPLSECDDGSGHFISLTCSSTMMVRVQWVVRAREATHVKIAVYSAKTGEARSVFASGMWPCGSARAPTFGRAVWIEDSHWLVVVGDGTAASVALLLVHDELATSVRRMRVRWTDGAAPRPFAVVSTCTAMPEVVYVVAQLHDERCQVHAMAVSIFDSTVVMTASDVALAHGSVNSAMLDCVCSDRHALMRQDGQAFLVRWGRADAARLRVAGYPARFRAPAMRCRTRLFMSTDDIAVVYSSRVAYVAVLDKMQMRLQVREPGSFLVTCVSAHGSTDGRGIHVSFLASTMTAPVALFEYRLDAANLHASTVRVRGMSVPGLGTRVCAESLVTYCAKSRSHVCQPPARFDGDDPERGPSRTSFGITSNTLYWLADVV